MIDSNLAAEQVQCELAQAGDRDALGRILSLHGPRLYRNVLLPRLGSVTAAEEALAATYLEAVKSFRLFAWEGVGVYPWLRQVALRVALRAIRKAGAERLCDPIDIAREIESGQHQVATIEEEHERARARSYVERALEGLSRQHAETLRLRLLEDRSREELAAHWGIAPNAVDQRVHRAKDALRLGLRAQEGLKEASPLMFVLVDGGRGPTVHVFNRPMLTIGRDPSSDLVLPGEAVSRHHAKLAVRESQFFVEDLGSSNGTIVGAGKLRGEKTIGAGQRIRIGGYTLQLVTTPLLSLWARAVLAESSREQCVDAPDVEDAAPILPPTAPLSEVLRRGAQAGADKSGTSSGEERIETLLRSAWQLGNIDGSFNERAVAAVLLTTE